MISGSRLAHLHLHGLSSVHSLTRAWTFWGVKDEVGFPPPREQQSFGLRAQGTAAWDGEVLVGTGGQQLRCRRCPPTILQPTRLRGKEKSGYSQPQPGHFLNPFNDVISSGPLNSFELGDTEHITNSLLHQPGFYIFLPFSFKSLSTDHAELI